MGCRELHANVKKVVGLLANWVLIHLKDRNIFSKEINYCIGLLVIPLSKMPPSTSAADYPACAPTPTVVLQSPFIGPGHFNDGGTTPSTMP